MTDDSAKYDEKDIITLAAEALGISDPVKSEDLYNQIVLKVQKAFNNNQRDVASELQRLSKSIEASRNTEDSLAFKQRTCESMLKISMAERHKGKTPPVLAPTKPPLPFKNLEYLYVGCNDFDVDVRFYKDTIKAELLWAFDKSGSKVAAFKMAYGPVLLLANHKKAPSIEPIFSVDNLETAVKSLKEKGISKLDGPIDTPNGKAYSFKDLSGNQFSILQNENPEAMERAYSDKSNKSAIRFD
ncbi:MAG: VOC family protein [Cyanobacteria bacterium SZAS-4]|nr:VOC family protein [Cyanobacteria bacterium SZAS-4]